MRATTPARSIPGAAHGTETARPTGAGQHGANTPGRVRAVLAAVVGLLVVAAALWAADGLAGLTGRSPAPMQMSISTVHPSGIRLTTVLLLAAIAVAHIVHMFHTSVRGRTWHAGHVVMALGMIDMAWPSGTMPVPARAGQIAFTALSLCAAVIVADDLTRRRHAAWVGILTVIDLAAMAHMFAMPVAGRGGLERLLIIWFIIEAMGWATGRIPVLGHNHTQAARTSTVTIRASLAAMSIIMAVMFLAMLPAPAHPMPGM